MGSIALIARELGHEVSGSDLNVYPPMSTQLQEQGIELQQGYVAEHLKPAPDLVIVGNSLSRGNEAVEYMLDKRLPFRSGPQWLFENVLHKKHVLAVAGTHGKTTTTTILTWILEYAGLNPGFLIGGVAENFSVSARMTESEFFVIEADEYDTAFFDKRSKFVHYHPSTLILNNMEFDHADIFSDIEAIQTQFHHVIRMVPNNGRLIINANDQNILHTVNQGCWTPLESFSVDRGQWRCANANQDCSQFSIVYQEQTVALVDWPLFGKHNAENALAAIAAANNVGVNPEVACAALSDFQSVKRRLETLAVVNGVTVYDDFAHHPTAIASTIEALRDRVGDARVVVILEPRSNTMKAGVHDKTLAPALDQANRVFLFQADDISWNLTKATETLGDLCSVHKTIEDIIESVENYAATGDHIVIMSNGGFQGIHQKLIHCLRNK